jgi:ABC-type phosphate transport system substrate-binding protein
MKTVIIIFLSTIMLSTISLAEEYAVIANKKIKDLSTAQIKAIFLKKITVIENINAVPVNLGARDHIREKFENEVVGMNFERLKSYWAKQHYLGKRPPVGMQSEESVKAFVKNVEGAIGYINANNLDNDIKVLYRWSE